MKVNRLYFFLFLLLVVNLLTINCKIKFDYSHEEKSTLKIQAGSISSVKGIIPFSYDKLKICHPKKIIKAEETIGEILRGEKIFDTSYLAFTGKNSYCEQLCLNEFHPVTKRVFRYFIDKQYFMNWYIDQLPAGLISFDLEKRKTSIDYFNGIPIGYKKDNEYFIYNHLQFHILLNDDKGNFKNKFNIGKEQSKPKYNVVGFSILPISIKHNGSYSLCSMEGGQDILSNFNKEPQPLNDTKILFTYDVIFEYSNITLGSRWDYYKPSNKKIHWISIVLSELIIVLCSVVIGCFLFRTIRNDIEQYNFRVVRIESLDEYSWKDLSGDVFRPPITNPRLLASLIGTGIQLFLMLSLTLFLGTLGFLNPERRANILNLGIILFCIMAFPGGYISARFYKLFERENWLINALLTTLIYPGTLLITYIEVNLFLQFEKSSAALSLLDIFSLFVLWSFCTFPLALMGSFFGIKKKKIKVPYKANPIPTIVPNKPFYLHYRYMTFITGIISFGTIFIELTYVMASLWKHQIYFLSAFLWISLILFIIVSGELSIIVVYWNLNKGDYNWWWKSFLIGGSPIIYFILYSIYFFFTLNIKRLSAIVVYFAIMSAISCMSMLICGSISTLITFWFVRFIYSRVKVD